MFEVDRCRTFEVMCTGRLDIRTAGKRRDTRKTRVIRIRGIANDSSPEELTPFVFAEALDANARRDPFTK